jgi:hypothetical protein
MMITILLKMLIKERYVKKIQLYKVATEWLIMNNPWLNMGLFISGSYRDGGERSIAAFFLKLSTTLSFLLFFSIMKR